MPKAPRVLIIEDEAVIRDLLAEFLTSLGYELELTANGEEGLQRAKLEPFSVVVADYGLPGMNGLEVCRKIAALTPSCRFVLITGWGSLEVIDREPCIDRVIPKPFDLIAVLNMLQELAPLPAEDPAPTG
jgi:CheY-like chemotaxis protein